MEELPELEEIANAVDLVAREAAKELADLLSKTSDALRKVDPEAVSESLMEALASMKETGEPLAQEAMEQIQQGLEAVLKELDDEQIQKLQETAGRLAADGWEGFLPIFQHLSELVAKAIDDGHELVQLALPEANKAYGAAKNVAKDIVEQLPDKQDIYELGGTVGEEISGAARKVAQEDVKEVADLLSKALAALSEIDPEAVGEDLMGALASMKETGNPLAQELT